MRSKVSGAWGATIYVNQRQNCHFLDDSQICLAAVNYTKIIDHWTLGRPIQVNGAFYCIKKSRVIKICTLFDPTSKNLNYPFKGSSPMDSLPVWSVCLSPEEQTFSHLWSGCRRSPTLPPHQWHHQKRHCKRWTCCPDHRWSEAVCLMESSPCCQTLSWLEKWHQQSGHWFFTEILVSCY